MKNKYLSLVIMLLFQTALFAQLKNPYAQFGYEGKVISTPQERQAFMVIVPNPDTTSLVSKIGIDAESNKVYYFDATNNVLGEVEFEEREFAKFLSVDPLTKDYPELTPFQFGSNTPIAAIDLDGLEGYLIINRYANNQIQSTVITRVRANNVLVNLNATGQLGIDDILEVNLGTLPNDVLSSNQRLAVNGTPQFTADEQAIMNAGIDASQPIRTRRTRTGPISSTTTSGSLASIGGFSFPGSNPPNGAVFTSNSSRGTYGNVPITTTSTVTVDQPFTNPIPPTNLAVGIGPAITATGVAGGRDDINNPSGWMTTSELNNTLISRIRNQINRGANINNVNVSRVLSNPASITGLNLWFNNDFVPAASASLGIPRNNFSLETPTTGNNFDFNLTLTGTISGVRQVEQNITNTILRWQLRFP